MKTLPIGAPSGATPDNGIRVPLAEIHLGTHGTGITAAVDEAYEMIRASLADALVTTEEAGR